MTDPKIVPVDDDAAETIIELVENVPVAYLILAAAIGGVAVYVLMIALSKAPEGNA